MSGMFGGLANQNKVDVHIHCSSKLGQTRACDGSSRVEVHIESNENGDVTYLVANLVA